MSNLLAPATRPLVACLCAAWCGVCREYQPLFEQVAGACASLADFAWVDIEDHDEVLGGLDVENFPTLLIAHGDAAMFFGTVTPHAQTLTRLVQTAAVQGLAAAPGQAPRELAGRVRRLFESGAL